MLKALEPARAAKTISAGLEARVTLSAGGDLADIPARKMQRSFRRFFIVSQVELVTDPLEGATTSAAIEGLQIRVERAQGAKCDRCWNYSTHVGENSNYPTLCERCIAALAEIERDGGPLNLIEKP